MENASKALIIAGAILLAILIISLGILIYNQASGVVTNNSMDEVSIQTFNNKFLQYAGEQKGSAVRALISQVEASNAADSSLGNVKLNYIGTGLKGKDDVNAGTTYTVTIKTSTDTGLVNDITITKPATTTTGS